MAATVSTHVVVRDDMGRFIADIENAAPKVVNAALDAGISASRSKAPERTGRLKGSFFKRIVSRTQGYFGNSAPYASFQDEGAGPHPITAHVSFFWEKMGRMWMSPETYKRVTGFDGADPINHPGNPAIHFMDAGYSAMIRAARRAMHRYYP